MPEIITLLFRCVQLELISIFHLGIQVILIQKMVKFEANFLHLNLLISSVRLFCIITSIHMKLETTKASLLQVCSH